MKPEFMRSTTMRGSGAPIVIGVFTVVLAGLAAGYFVLQTYTPPASATPVTPEVRQFRVSVYAFQSGEETFRHWIPSTIVVNAGDTVILRVTNHDPDSSHGFGLAAFDISVSAIRPGEVRTFRFTATRPGIFRFGCAMTGCAADHADQAGQLIVLGR